MALGEDCLSCGILEGFATRGAFSSLASKTVSDLQTLSASFAIDANHQSSPRQKLLPIATFYILRIELQGSLPWQKNKRKHVLQ